MVLTEQRSHKRLDVRRWLDILSSIALLIGAALVTWKLYAPQEGRSLIEDVENLTLPADGIQNMRGSGPVVLVEFGDFECPSCAHHTSTTGQLLHTRYVQQGKLRHVFLHFPLAIHPGAQKAAEASECAGEQAHFWKMHDGLFAERSFDVSALNARATAIGLDKYAFDSCLSGGKMGARVLSQILIANRLGVNSTPSFFLGLVQEDGSVSLRKRIIGTAPFKVFQDAIDALARA